MDAFHSKVRRFGNSLGVIVPREWLREQGLEEGDMVELRKEPTREERYRKLLDSMGMLAGKGLPPFEREKEDRVDRWLAAEGLVAREKSGKRYAAGHKHPR